MSVRAPSKSMLVAVLLTALGTALTYQMYRTVNSWELTQRQAAFERTAIDASQQMLSGVLSTSQAVQSLAVFSGGGGELGNDFLRRVLSLIGEVHPAVTDLSFVASIPQKGVATPERRTSLENARDMGQPVAVVEGAEDRDATTRPTLMLFAPIYRTATIPKDKESRRKSFKGFLSATIVLQPLIAQIAENLSREQLELLLFDSSKLTPANVVVHWSPGEVQAAEKLVELPKKEVESALSRAMQASFPISIGTGVMTFVIVPTEASADRWLPLRSQGVFMLGLILSAGLGWCAFIMLGRADRVESAVTSRTMQLKSTVEELHHEIEERRQVEVELKRAEERANEATQRKSLFLTGVSHEIRTPMHGIVGLTELLSEAELGKQQREYVEMIRFSAESLLTVIDDIRDLAKIEAGSLAAQRVEFDLNEYMERTVGMLEYGASQKNALLILNVPQSLPRRLIGDPVRMQQILMNLITNAIKFVFSGGAVIVQVLQNGEAKAGEKTTLHFVVSDTGIGVPYDIQDKIFQAFEQPDPSAMRRYGASGLGLTISAQLVRLLGGRIWLKSIPYRGTAFHFELPFEVPAQQPEAVAPKQQVEETLPERNSAARNKEEIPATGSGRSELKERRGRQQRDPQGGTQRLDADTLVHEVRERVRAEEQQASLPSEEKQERSRVISPESTSNGSKSLHILLAEDHVVSQRVLARLLESLGHTVQVVDTGRLALERSLAEEFDLILMDIEMPDMDGYSAAQCIRESEQVTGKHIPIIALTAHAMKNSAQQCLTAGMDDYMAKPVRRADLCAVIERNLIRLKNPLD